MTTSRAVSAAGVAGAPRLRRVVDADARTAQRAVAVAAGSRCRSVCLCTASADPSGMGAHMLDLAAELRAELDVTVMAWASPRGRRVLDGAAALGVRAVALPHPRDRAYARTVEQALRSCPVDVFHLHAGTGREDFDTARAARAAGVPALVQTLHLPWLMGSVKHRGPLLHSLEPVDRLIAVSTGQRRTYERAGVPAELFATVLNGISPGTGLLPRGDARRALGVEEGQRVVLAVGRLLEQKGHATLLEAVPALAARCPDVVVVVVGHGPLPGRLERQAADLDVGDRVRLTGFVADARTLLSAADVFALPSRYEALPLAALEAMDAGLPVVATDAIGVPEVVVDGVTGLLVPRGDVAALAGALGDLLDEAERAGRLGAAGRARFLEHFTNARMSRETRAVYEDVLASSRIAASA